MKRNIAVFTFTRADYGHLYWVIKHLSENKLIELDLYVGGSHLKEKFGKTITKIQSDGFKIKDKIDYLLDDDNPTSICKSLAKAAKLTADIFQKKKPDILLLLGDRYELLAIAQTAMIFNIPIAHIHGGEKTEGAMDDAIRHCITKMSHIHFASTDIYKKRIEQLGEDSKNVFNFGAPGIDNILEFNLMTPNELSLDLKFKLTKNYFVVTYHPVTIGESKTLTHGLENLLHALNEFQDYQLIVTYPNADTYASKLIKLIKKYKLKNKNRVLVVKSLGQLRYLSLLKHANAVIGNSSSGIIEAPTFKIPTVNIGTRQKGRIFGETVINCNSDKKSIIKAINLALDKNFLKECKKSKNPYGNGGSSLLIANKLASVSLDMINMKSFKDM